MFTFVFQHVRYYLNVNDEEFFHNLRRQIGKGSEALVYDNGKNKSPVVVKIMLRNINEAYIAQTIRNVFPEIYRVESMFCECGTKVTLILMEKMEVTLNTVKKGTMEGAIKALRNLHAQGYLMGDVYLCNFMVNTDDLSNVKIVDFGRITLCQKPEYHRMEIDKLKLRFC